MVSHDSGSIPAKKLAASLVAILSCLSAGAACATNERDVIRENVRDARQAMHEARQELRLQRREDNIAERITRMQSMPTFSSVHIATPSRGWSGGVKPTMPFETQGPRFNIQPVREQRLPRVVREQLNREASAPTALELSARSTYTNDDGRTKSLSRGVDLDLSSTDAHITIGENTLSQPITIEVGGQTKTISAGSRVTAAEYVALSQMLATGTQSLTLSAAGSAVGGTVNLNVVSDDGNRIRASEFVVPQDVSVSGDFSRTADGVRVTHDLVNFGSIVATSSDRNKNTAFIAARDIVNQSSGSISTGVTPEVEALNLNLRAERDFDNQGSISSAGSLEISAGRSLSNSHTSSLIKAEGNVVLSSSNISNRGVVTSTSGNITLTGTDQAALSIDNYGGQIRAVNGAIDLRSADYSGTSASTVYGGDLISKELNIHAGNGIANLTANEVSGILNTSGLGAHVSVNSEELVLGTQCLTGDPTYYNTGSIRLDGDITVGEKLAIIAGGDVFSGGLGIAITARDVSDQGYDITIVAGANIVSGSGEAPFILPGQPPISNNATGPVTISGATELGGDIRFGGQSNATVTISSASASGNRSGGNVLLAAMAGTNNEYGGWVTLGPNSTIDASGSGTGSSGSVTIIAGRTNGSGIEVDNIINDGGTGAAGGVSLIAAQPISSDGSPIVFDTTGAIISGNSLIASSTAVFGGINVQQISSRGDVVSRSNNLIVVDAIATTGSTSITSGTDIAVGSISTQSGVDGIAGGNVTLNAANNVTVTSINTSHSGAVGDGGVVSVSGLQLDLGNIDASGGATGVGGDISLSAGAGGATIGQLVSSGATGGAISVSANNSDISITGGVIADNGGELSISLIGSSAQTATVNGNFLVSSLKTIGGGTVDIDAGANPVYIDAVGSTQNLNLSTTNSAVGIENNAVINTTGSLYFNTPRFTNNANIDATTVSVYSDGDLSIYGNGSTISVSNNVFFSAAPESNLRLFGTMNFNGDVELRSTNGTVTSEAGSLYVGNDDVRLVAFTWTQLGGGNIIGNDFIMAGFSIVNPTGDVTLLSDQVYFGRDLAIFALGNINLGTTEINLSSTTGDAGSLTLFAGYGQFPLTGGQQITQQNFTLDSSPTGGSIFGADSTIVLSSTAGNGGNLVAVSSRGSIALGDIDTGSSAGDGGAVTLIAPEGVQAGNINSAGSTGGGDIVIASSSASFGGSFIEVDAGTLKGIVEPQAETTAAAISVGSISAGSAAVSIKNSGPSISSGAISANQITIATSGVFSYGSNAMTASAASSGDGGVISIKAASVESVGAGPLALAAVGTTDGGSIDLMLTSDLVLGASGDVTLDARGASSAGSVRVQSGGSLTLDAGGVLVAGQNGDGAYLELDAGTVLQLNDVSSLAAVNATGSNGGGGALVLSGGDIVFQSSSSTPLLLSANGIGIGNGGVVSYSNGSAATTVVGTPSSAVPSNSNFITISAKSGDAGGNGGRADILTGGDIVVDTSGLLLGPQSSSGNWDGARTFISTQPSSDKAGNILIEGDLRVDAVGNGQGGIISITSNSKDDFVVGPTRTVKNGILGGFSAAGSNGTIVVRNDSGGILINTSTSMNASEVRLVGAESGSITTSKGVVLTAPDLLILSTTGSGSIGKKPLLVNAPRLVLSSLNGSVNVEDLSTSTVTLESNSRAAKEFSLTTAGSLTIRQNSTLRTTSGDINLTTKSGTLLIDQNSHLEANKGAISLLNEDLSNGDILINSGSIVETKSKGRNISISIGKARKMREPVPPIFVVSTTGSGKAYFSTGVEAPTATAVNANGRSITFYNGSTNAAKKITVYGSTITAEKN